ncbi:MAG: NAD(P)(+) transhydrogenase (Re/Si-specific) subunit beta, partial [Planctomycetota bacterium]
MDATIIRNLFYILAAVLFIFGIKGLTHPRTAVRGNLLGALGMLIAIVVTLIDKQMIGWGWIIAGVVIGGGIGAVLAIKIQMTGMPQLVALYNGFGGIASVFVAGAVFHEYIHKATQLAEQLGREVGVFEAIASPLMGVAANPTQVMVATIASGIIGGVTFS